MFYRYLFWASSAAPQNLAGSLWLSAQTSNLLGCPYQGQPWWCLLKISKSSLTPSGAGVLPCPRRTFFPLANLNSHHEKTLKRTEIHPAPTGQHPAFQSQKHRCRPLAQPGVLHFRRTKIIWAHSIRHKATLPELHGQGGDGMPAWHFQPEPSPWDDAFPPQNHALFPNTDPKTRGNESGTRRDLQGVCSSSR